MAGIDFTQGMTGKNASCAVGIGTTRLTLAFSIWMATPRVLIPVAALASAPLTFFCKSVVAATADTRELYIKTKVEDMIVYGNICLKQFPKHERYALASEIRLCMYRILGIVIETNHKHYKKTTLTELDIEVDKLRSYLRLSVNPELKYLSVDKYGNWAAMVDEIGRMVGGWIQSVSK